MMAPSTSHLLASSSAEDAGAVPRVMVDIDPEKHPENPLLYLIPEDLRPTYRPLPRLVQTAVILASAYFSAVSTWERFTFIQPLAILRKLRPAPPLRELIAFATKTILGALIVQLSLQEIFCRPSRISVNNLRERYYLPSTLSQYQNLQVSTKNEEPAPIGIHYLKYANGKKGTLKLDAIYVHHGFGASSLSWLPTLPSLVDRLDARVGLGHDMVGFGFTDRQDILDWYTTDSSARISQAVFSKEVEANGYRASAALLFGHSLGAIGVLKMALGLPREISKHVILCSPALGLSGNFSEESNENHAPRFFRRVKNRITSFFRSFVIFPTGGYILRRAVGSKNFWRRGLEKAAWGNPDKLKASDVLRYQWPSIGRGWERGLLQFASAQRRNDDISLLREVLNLPNTTVSVIIGSNDKVIRPDLTRDFLANFEGANIRVIELDGLGHTTFEEDVDTFVNAVEGIVNDASSSGF